MVRVIFFPHCSDKLAINSFVTTTTDCTCHFKIVCGTIGLALKFIKRLSYKRFATLGTVKVFSMPFVAQSWDTVILDWLVARFATVHVNTIEAFLTVWASCFWVKGTCTKWSRALCAYEVFRVPCLIKCRNNLSKDRLITMCTYTWWRLLRIYYTSSLSRLHLSRITLNFDMCFAFPLAPGTVYRHFVLEMYPKGEGLGLLSRLIGHPGHLLRILPLGTLLVVSRNILLK